MDKDNVNSHAVYFKHNNINVIYQKIIKITLAGQIILSLILVIGASMNLYQILAIYQIFQLELFLCACILLIIGACFTFLFGILNCFVQFRNSKYTNFDLKSTQIKAYTDIHMKAYTEKGPHGQKRTLSPESFF